MWKWFKSKRVEETQEELARVKERVARLETSINNLRDVEVPSVPTQTKKSAATIVFLKDTGNDGQSTVVNTNIYKKGE